VSDERALQRRHADSVTVLHAIAHYFLHLPFEELQIVRSRVSSCLPVAVKVREERSGLFGNGIVNETGQVDAAGPNERWIESIYMVCREEYDPLFARGDAIQSVQEPRESHRRLISACSLKKHEGKGEQVSLVLTRLRLSARAC
jgi:hypothetical protein